MIAFGPFFHHARDMCGRFALPIPRPLVAEAMALEDLYEAPPRYNIAPSQLIDAVHVDKNTGRRIAGLFHWGLVPSWAKDQKVGYRMINARAAGIFDKPAFRAAIRSRRCLIPAQGFYEWQHTGGNKAPYFITLADDGVMALAGIFEHWSGPDGQVINSAAILTRDASGVVRQIHDRQPVILPPKVHGAWLDPHHTDRHDIEEVLNFPPPELTAVPVGTLVNSPRNDGPELLTPIGPPLIVA